MKQIYKRGRMRYFFDTSNYIKDEKMSGEIYASGVLIYRENDNCLEILMINKKDVYEDLGGVVDKTDKDVYHTAAREAYEESNGLICTNSLYERIENTKPIYNPKSKYCIFLAKATPEEEILESNQFGDKEYHDNIDRTISWIKYEDLCKMISKKKVNFRMHNREILKRLSNTKTNHQDIINLHN